jgi:hypothetical protein
MTTRLIVYAVGLTLALAVSTVSCSDPDTARRVLDENGYTDVEIGGYDAFGCAKDDDYTTTFAATSPGGRRVHGVVCSSLWSKGATIRFY